MDLSRDVFTECAGIVVHKIVNKESSANIVALQKSK